MDRVLLTVATLAFAIGVYLLMLKGWRGRQRRQGDLPPPPAPPASPGEVVVGAVPGLFVGTTHEGAWLDRVNVHGLSDRSAGWVEVTTAGVHVEREGVADLHLPYDVLLSAQTGDALAGKFVGRDGMLVLTWQLGPARVVSGFRADDHAAHARLAEAISARIPARTPSPEETP